MAYELVDDSKSRYELVDEPASIDPTEGMSGPQKFLAGAGKGMVDVYRGGKQLLGLASQDEIDEAKKLDAPLMNTGAGVAGNVVGNMAAFLPAAFVPGANTLAGAAVMGGGMGALTPTATGDSRATNMAIGAGGGMAGYGLGKGLSKLITPTGNQLSAAQQRALEAGEKLGAQVTPGVRTGSPGLRGLEAGMESFPATSGPMRAPKVANQSLLNKSAAKSIGETADELTSDVLANAHTRIGSAFNKVESIKEVPVGDAVQNKLASVEFKYRGLLDKPLAEYDIVKDIYASLGKGITGKQYNDWQSQLGKIARSKFTGARSEPNVGYALMEVKDALDDAAAAVMTGAEKDAFKTARQQWRNLMMLETGNVVNEQTGNVSGKLLANVLSRKDKHGFRLGGTSNDLYDMARFYKAFPDIVGDSGTATRSALPWMLGSGLVSGAASGVATGADPTKTLGAAVLTPLAIAAAARGGQSAYMNPLMQSYLANQLLSPAAQAALSRAGALAGPAGALAQQKRQ
jgi:hypothetical protein